MRRSLLAAILLAAVAVAALLVLGRSQIAAITPVGGLQTSLVRAAGIDVLVQRGVPLGRAPVCATEASRIVCTGDRADGAPVRLEGPATAPPDGTTPVTVTVAGQVLATVPAEAVVDAAGSGGDTGSGGTSGSGG